MTTQPEDHTTAGNEGRGHLRASHADRERVIGALKAAFVQGMLGKDEFDARVGQTLVSQTYAELATLTADIPAGLTTAEPPAPARAQAGAAIPRPGIVLTVATALYAGAWVYAIFSPAGGNGDQGGSALVSIATVIYLIVVIFAGAQLIESRREKRSGRPLPRRPAPGEAVRASQRPPSTGRDRQLPQAGHDLRHTAEVAPRRRRRPLLPV